jgi:hypothetical protein
MFWYFNTSGFNAAARSDLYASITQLNYDESGATVSCRVFGEVVYDVELSLNLWTTQALQKPLTKCAPLGGDTENCTPKRCRHSVNQSCEESFEVRNICLSR